jgi:hypothetical protein
MLFWHKSHSRDLKICPFCSSAQPDYVTRLVPQALAISESQPQSMSFFSDIEEAGPSGECDGISPFELEFFMVQGCGYRCMAYRNADGKWRGAFDGEELPGAIRVLG